VPTSNAATLQQLATTWSMCNQYI